MIHFLSESSHGPSLLCLYCFKREVQFIGYLLILFAVHIHKKYFSATFGQVVNCLKELAINLFAEEIIVAILVHLIYVGSACYIFGITNLYILVFQVVERSIANGII